MNRVIYKYPIDVDGFGKPCRIALPAGALPLTANKQDMSIYAWIIVDTDLPSDSYIDFYVFPTGFIEIPEDLLFLSTILDGSYVWHVFCKLPE